MERWDELRTAYWVARLGTVSAAAERLGVHRATVVRHVDALEQDLGAKLFQRHGRGYLPTEAGEELLRVARSADEQFEDFAGRLRGRSAEVSGEVVVTSIPLAAPLVMPGIALFRRDHPDVLVRYEASSRILALQYGEAHVAIRAGSRPSHPDNVVRRFGKLRSGIYAHRDYLERHGWPEGDGEGHAFVSESGEGSVIERWRSRIAPGTSVAFASADARINLLAISAGIGMSFLPEAMAAREPDLVEIHGPRREWDIPLWLVTHVDLHWTAKVQAVSRALLPE